MPNWFAAIPVELPGDHFASLRSGAPDGLRWFAPEDLHVTIAFFGAFREERVEEVKSAIMSLPPPDIRVTAGPLLALPSARHFSAVSLSIAGGSGAAAAWLKRHHEELMSAAGLPPDPRESVPHITIARPLRKAPPRQRRTILNWMRQWQPLPAVFHLHRLALYQGMEDRTERQFHILAESSGRDAGGSAVPADVPLDFQSSGPAAPSSATE
jgi:2'-5' RNA ligase